MKEQLKDQRQLLHIKVAIENITTSLTGKTAEDFLVDQMLYYAIVKNLEIIGEAAYMLTNEFKNAHATTNWKDIINMRHIFVHSYYQVDSSIVWVSIRTDFPILEKQIDEYLKEEEYYGE